MKIFWVLVPLATVLLLSAVLSLPVADSNLDDEFNKWKITHEKVYDTPEEEAERRAIWEKTRIQVNAHNKEADQGLHSYWQGLNQFSDEKPEERSRGFFPVWVREPELLIDNSSLIVDSAGNNTVLLLNSTGMSI